MNLMTSRLEEGGRTESYPVVTYVVPVYNRAKELPRLLSAIVAQTYRPLEVVLVDDGSSDCSWAVIQNFAGTSEDLRIGVRSHRQERRGVSAARNAGVELASGRVIGFLDSDDWIPPDRTKALFNGLRDCSAELCYGNHTRKLKDFVPCEWVEPPRTDRPTIFGPEHSISYLKLAPLVVSFLAHADIVRSAGGFSEELSIMEDFEWIVRLKVQADKIVKIQDCVYVQCDTQNSLVRENIGAFDQRIVAEAKMLRSVLSYWRIESTGRRLARGRLIRQAVYAFRAQSIRWFVCALVLVVASFVPERMAGSIVSRLAGQIE